MKTIHEILKMTKDEYDMLVMNWWTTYCFEKGKTPKNAQKLLINNTVFHWWYAQLEIVELEFAEDALPFLHQYTQEDASKLYAKHAYKLQKYYNSNLIKEALQ